MKMPSVNKRLFLTIILLSMFPASAQQELTPNTDMFVVSDYYYPDQRGNYRRFDVSGFVDKPIDNNVRRTVRFLPQLEIDLSKIKFIDSSGNTIRQENTSRVSIKSIQIPINFLASLPVAEQIPAIVGQLGGNPMGAFLPQPVAPPASARPSVHNAIREYTSLRAPQEQNMKNWENFNKNVVSMTELELSLQLGADLIWTKKFPGTVVNLPPIEIQNPDENVLNRIKNGTFFVSATYNFRDSKITSIDASFDVEAILSTYLSDTQKAVQQNKSTAFKIFGLGQRRSRIKQSFNRKISEASSSQSVARTVIIMDDADDSMIKQFESIFFPVLAKEDVIKEHRVAAETAKSEGNVDLAKVHEDYAKAVMQNDALAEVDAVGAAAALSSGNYAMFVAKGVRAQISDDNSSTRFTKLLSSKETIDQAVLWTNVSKRSTQRSVTVAAINKTPVPRMPTLGICGTEVFVYVGSPSPPPRLPGEVVFDFGYRGNYLEITCIEKNSPLHQSGIAPGDGLLSIDGNHVNSQAEVEQRLRVLEPGLKVMLRIVKPYQAEPKVVSVELASGPPLMN